uniref:Acetyl-coenzyme A carboxylase carboxyl transferase subunit beta n=1 Tax=Coccomyxa subellipsoidea (strain C-169) TaxID=574566 RepID=E9NPU9_COCSC|nr:acetyl-CoA carboxylase beta subunit [Coccomyxa subellipsoidea C-169]ADV29875.1 acetyl-CoA carboxylase beta subunit [Coccomyxa subellipsoidea C-169]
MSILAWIEDQRKLKLLNAPKYNHPASDGSKGLWTRCDHCGVILYIKHLKENQRVCFGCGYHLQMNSQERIDYLIDENTWRPLDETLSPCDPLEFRDQKPYTERLKDAQEKTGLQDAVQTGTGMLDGIPIALGVMDFHFMGGSMGSVVGEKITRLIEYAAQEGLTLVLVCASGGARMQEGIFSLMQMAKISSALQIYQSCANLLYISVLTSPTTGGVTASFAMLGDLIFAEPKALIGFAGRRVIEQTLQEDLPDDFQTSEYLLHHGLLDLIVPRCFLKQALSETITLYKDAPFKRAGSIPYGIQNSLYFLTEEKTRRKWHQWTSSRGDANNSWPLEGKSDGASESNEGQTTQLLDACLSNAQFSAPNYPSEQPFIRVPSDVRAADAPLLGSPQGMKEVEDSPSIHALGLLDDTAFKTTLAAWLKDSSRDEPYRQILVSFQTMFSLFAAGSSSCTVSPSSGLAKTNQSQVLSTTGQAETSRKDGSDSSGTQEKIYGSSDRSQALETQHGRGTPTDGLPMASRLLDSSLPVDQYGQDMAADLGIEQGNTRSMVNHTSHSAPLLELALSIGTKEVVAWRAFYTSQKLSPKAMFLEHLEPIHYTASESQSNIYKAGEAEKKFFYQLILNNSRD